MLMLAAVVCFALPSSAADDFTRIRVNVASDYVCSPRAIKISWSKVAGADGYRVYRYTSSGWKGLGNVGPNTTAYYEGNLQSGTAYIYNVRAFKKSGSGYDWTLLSQNKYVTTRPGAVSISSKAGYANSVKLSWGVVKGNGYQVWYKIHGANGWNYAGRTTHMAYNSFTVSGLNANTYYDFAVRAYRTDENGRMNTGEFAITGCSTCSGKVGNVYFGDYVSTPNACRITWRKVPGAMGYRVFRYESGKWVTLGNVNADTLYYTDSRQYSASAAEQRYTVRAYANYNGSMVFSDEFYNCFVRMAPLQTDFRTSTGIVGAALVAGYNRTDYSTGFDVYYKLPGDTSWTYVTSTSDGFKSAICVEGMPKGKTVTLAIRAYARDRNNKRVNGPFQTITASIPSVFSSSSNQTGVRDLVNKERSSNGLSAYTLDPTLCELATVRAYEVAFSFSHTRPDGSEGTDILDEYGVKYTAAAECIAYGYESPSAVVSGWMNSSGHRANNLSSTYRKMGVGYCPINRSWVELFTN